MQRYVFSICSNCRSLLLASSPLPRSLPIVTHEQHRLRSTSSQTRRRRRNAPSAPKKFSPPTPSAHKRFTPPTPYASQRSTSPRLSTRESASPLFFAEKIVNYPPKNVAAFFKTYVVAWAKSPRLPARFAQLGIPESDVQPLLTAFIADAQVGYISAIARIHDYGLDRFAQVPLTMHKAIHIDNVYTGIFIHWLADPANESVLSKLTSRPTLFDIRRLVSTANIGGPELQFMPARAIRRKVIMHVGPTNSGKTYNALRALAAARSGIYGGPLRLLAHEIWERLNNGQIVPLGVDPATEEHGPDAEADDRTNFDVLPELEGRNALRKVGKAKYARPCNLLTGEDQKIVHESAPLVSCTVEMMSNITEFDVGVIDEIQMIADPKRGGAWTNALLGLCAKELHLCGEETAVPLVKAVLQGTGDELVVNRYQRLAPLQVEDKSLQGRLDRIRPGDCLVTFSRASIFELKEKIERDTGLRCAVVYGGLPPEVRSEQAALFNSPDSGYDVLVGSDAIGMGLNLKIRRVIFSTTRKFDGRMERVLSDSQIRQIAGRAGRYGMHSDNPAGLVTCIYKNDLPIIRTALGAAPVPLPVAYLQFDILTMMNVHEALPRGSSLAVTHAALCYIWQLKPVFCLTDPSDYAVMMEFLDRQHLTLQERLFFMSAPIVWRDEAIVAVVEVLIRLYCNDLYVGLNDLLQGSNFQDTLADVERMMDVERVTGSAEAAGVCETADEFCSPLVLRVLESFHRTLTLYMWLSYRNPVVWADHEECHVLKLRVEKALDGVLQGMGEEQILPAYWSSKPTKEKGKVSYLSGHEQRKQWELRKTMPQPRRLSVPLRLRIENNSSSL